jgi:alpha-D-ribose 1-methylphosphonate 5-triphosphate diphosphatase PhnM
MSYPGFSTNYKVQTLAGATVVLIATRPVSCATSFPVDLSVLMASPNNLRLKNYNGSIAPSQLADARAVKAPASEKAIARGHGKRPVGP